jgi:membrane fusion protein, adhesin transport system
MGMFTRRRNRLSREDAEFVTGRAAADLQRPRIFAHILLLVIASFFGIAFAWASWASLDEVTRGDGRVIPSSQVQVVQNLEGGIVAAMLVREGEIVERGQVLLRIDNVRAASDFRESRKRYLALLGSLARLRAEVMGSEQIAFADEVLSEAGEVVSNETALFQARKVALRNEVSVLESQVEQREQELAELRSRQAQLERSLALAREELAMTEPLAARGVVSRVEALRLRRQVNDLEGELEAVRLSVPRIESARREGLQRIDERTSAFHATSQRELTAVQAEVEALRETITAEEDRVQRTEVRSPVRGTVQQVMVHTVGGVVQPGADLIEIVPLEDTLLVEARVRPADIAFLRPGLPAVVKITAYDFAIYGGLAATVEDISADTIVDERGERFYRIRVRTEEAVLERAGEPLPIIPGMTAQVDILTGEKTVLDYLLKPILRARDHALRER